MTTLTEVLTVILNSESNRQQICFRRHNKNKGKDRISLHITNTQGCLSEDEEHETLKVDQDI